MDYKTTRSNATLKLILVIVFLALAVTITFVIGYGVGRFAGNSSTPSGSNDSRMNTLQAVYDILAKDFYYGEDSEDYRSKLIDDAINGMVDAQGDIHTDYMTPEEVRQFNGALESNIVGIGIRYTELDGQILVLEVLRDSPAEKAGIQEGDIITAVDGVSCRESSVDYVANLVRGQIGTSVRISIDRMGKPVELTAVRAVIGTTVSSEVRDGIGVLRISSFGDQTSEELGEHLKYLEDNKVTRYIIDLRNNGGGYAQTLDKMCAYFMNNGEIVMVEEDRDGRQIIDKVKNSQKIKYDKIVILINESSASCSEVFTMALKENCGAVTVGTTSYGKGLAQLQKLFRDGSAIKYTDVIWKSGNGVFINGKGITPDYEVRLHDALYMPYLNFDDEEVYEYDEVSSKVAVAQSMLDFLGYDPDRRDGYFSEATRQAVMKFQNDNGLTADGKIDKKTATVIDTKVVFEWNTNRSQYDVQMDKAMELVRE